MIEAHDRCLVLEILLILSYSGIGMRILYHALFSRLVKPY
jgi:hypothetical protein